MPSPSENPNPSRASPSSNPSRDSSPPASLSPTLPPRKRRLSGSPAPDAGGSYPGTPRSDGDGGDDWQRDAKRSRTGERDREAVVCRDFLRNRCSRSELECKYAHPHPGVTIDGDKVIICGDSLRNQCFRGRTCRYYHPPPHILESMLRMSGVEDPKVKEVCRDFLRGRCARLDGECRFLHHSSVQNRVVVCQDYLRGRCYRSSCRYSHATGGSMPYMHPAHIHGADMVYMPPMPMPMPMPMMVPPSPRAVSDRNFLPVCQDFLKRSCTREFCKYAHPISDTKVIEDRVEICRDFQRGACNRSPCRFYHQTTSSSPGL